MSVDELAASIHSDPELNRTTLIMLVPVGSPVDLSYLEGRGFVDYVTKPVMLSELTDALFHVVTGADVDLTRKHRRLQDAEDSSIGFLNRPSNRNVRILLAEDNEVNQDVVVELLSLAGHACDVVGDGRLAVDALIAQRYDLVLMDCHMPEVDGLKATQLIRQHEQADTLAHRGSIPIIALTANAMPGERERCLSVGMTDYLSKPIDPTLLFETIELHLRRNERSDDAPTANTTDEVPRAADIGGEYPADSSQSPDQLDGAGTKSVLDVDALLNRCLGHHAIAEKLLRKFLSALPGNVQQIEHCIVVGDADRLIRLAHTLKGAAANLAADPLQHVAAHLEEIAHSGNLDRAGNCLIELEVESRRFLETAPSLFDRNGSATSALVQTSVARASAIPLNKPPG